MTETIYMPIPEPQPSTYTRATSYRPVPSGDNVSHPAHYTKGGVECIDAIEAVLSCYMDASAGFMVGQVIKYLWRAPLKGAYLEDLKKARWYLDRVIEREEQHDS